MVAERFRELEKELLLNLILVHKSVLENKKTDAVSCAAKVRSWQAVEKQFNSHKYVTKRPWKILRKAWENMKARRKRAIAEERRRMDTGEGPFLSNKNMETNPELEITDPSINVNVENVGDSDMFRDTQVVSFELWEDLSESKPFAEQNSSREESEMEGKSSDELNDELVPTSSTSRTSSTYVSRSAAVEKELHVRVKKVMQSMEYEAKLHEIRLETAKTEREIKAAQLRHQEEMYAQEMRQMEEKARLLKEAHETSMLQQQLQHEQIMENLRKPGGHHGRRHF